MSRIPRCTQVIIAIACALALPACGDGEPATGGHPVLGENREISVDTSGTPEPGLPPDIVAKLSVMAEAAAQGGDLPTLTVDYPLDESIFPPEFVPPTFLWHDGAQAADTWLVTIEFAGGASSSLRILVPGAPPPRGEIDLEAVAETNRIYEGTEYQRSARSWTPGRELWERIKRRSAATTATVSFNGFSSAELTAPLSRGSVRISTSTDPVGAPIFYRDLPLMSFRGETGRIKPLRELDLPLVAWRLKDVSRPDSKLVLKGIASCANCHSFSRDGGTLAMDLDGPDGDKGMYAIKPVSKEMVLGSGDVITWNSFSKRPKDHRTLGFMARISPDGQTVMATLNESLYVANFSDFRFNQVFFPTRGILAFHRRDTDEITALPGADDPEFVHCSPAWSPDGKHVVFSRATAREPYVPDVPLATAPNDPNETQIRYDLYRIPFNGGSGGEAVPLEGASNNGVSNTFPRISPDGKWVVFTKCGNGLLMRPDSRLWIVPFAGGEAREMRCNTPLMNSWHSFSPNGRWMVFSSKANTPYTQAFLTHIDESGNDSPAILVPNCTAANRAVNVPEFLNAPFDALDTIRVPAVEHHAYLQQGRRQIEQGDHSGAVTSLTKAIELEPSFTRAFVLLGHALIVLGRHEEALEHLDTALKKDPRNLYVIWSQYVVYRKTERPRMALRILDHLLELSPEFPAAKADRPGVEAELKALATALEAAEADLAKVPDNVDLNLQVAELNHRAGNLERTAALLRRACALQPEEPYARASLAWLLATNPDDGIRDGMRAVTLAESAVRLTEGKAPEMLDILAAALAEAGRQDIAVQTSRRAVALARETKSPNLPAIERRLARHESGKPVRSIADR